MSPQANEERLGFPPCMVPPRGWVCTREPGHDGPCAAHPVDSDVAAEQIESLKACLTLANKEYVKVIRKNAGLREALTLLAGNKCETYTVGECRNDSDRTKTAQYTAFRWCNACIARDALEKNL